MFSYITPKFVKEFDKNCNAWKKINFEWDEDKNRANKKNHGIDFKNITSIFNGILMRRIDQGINYGEIRWKALGEVSGRVFCIVYTIRKNKIRLISARKATKRERTAYEKFKNKVGTY